MSRSFSITFALSCVVLALGVRMAASDDKKREPRNLLPYHGAIVDSDLNIFMNTYKSTDRQLQGIPGLLKPNDKTAASATSYVDVCKANAVPIPPNWPDAAWVDRGEQKLLFASFPNSVHTEVFTYQAPNNVGLCYALPRKNADGGYEALGIICQSRETGKACFWDNIDDATDDRITGKDIKLDISKLRNGSDLDENCTACHRGPNVFLIHPDTALGAVSGRNPKQRYSPIGRQEFANPPATEQLGDSACSQCHEIAALDEPYCGFLAKAADLTMPPKPDTPTGWASPSPVYKSAIDSLKQGCAKFGKSASAP